MLPATLLTLVSFLLEFSISSPLYNMQPAFVATTHIGSFTGRNIRNLPCISRKNPSQTGVCMFAIDCLKSNGTHLGTCIDRFYFGSCCHIEPHITENTIDTEIIDVREPPVRLHNTTTSIITTTSIPTSTNITLISTTQKSSVSSSKQPSTTTNKLHSSVSLPSSTIKPEIMSSITKKPSRITSKLPQSSSINKITQSVTAKLNATTTKPSFEDKIPSLTTTENSAVPEKLQTFQLIDGTLVETTTFKQSDSTDNKKTVPTKLPTKPYTSTAKPSTTTTLRPIVTVTKPAIKPSAAQKVTNKPTATSKPTKVSKPTIYTKVTYKPTKPTKVTSTTSRTTTVKGSTTNRPTKTPTKPSSKPVVVFSTETLPSVKPTSLTKVTTKTPEIFLNTTSKFPSTTVSSSTVSPETQNVTKGTILSTTPSSTTKIPMITEAPVSKQNASQLLEESVGNDDTNEISDNEVSSSTTSKAPGLVTWTFENNKTTVLGGNAGVILTNITEEWIPLNENTSDGWVLLPTATHQTVNKNETLSTTKPIVSSLNPLPSVTVIVTTEESTLSGEIILNATTLNLSSTTVTAPTQSEKPVIFTDLPLVTIVPQNNTDFVWFSTTVSQTPINSTETSTISSDSFTAKENVTSSSIPSSTTNKTVDSTVGESSTINGSTNGLPSSTVSTGGEPEIKPVNMSDFTDVCGRRMYPGARIVGGEKSAYGRWPWQISLRQWRTSTYLHKCGAALLNENWAITAAHCVDNVPPNDLLLRLGEYDLSTDSEPYLHQERRVQIVASHPQFDPSTFEYDLALLRFYEPVTFQPNILPVCVPKNDESFVGKTAFVTGWGRLYEDGPLPSILQEVSVPVINNSVCETMYRSAGYIEHIPNIFICAGWRRGGFDSCEGDSGGPMVIQREDKRFQLAGIISWGIGCAEPNQPGVYTRISEFRDWINQILQF